MKKFRRLVSLLTALTLVFGITALIGDFKQVSAKESYTIDFGYYEARSGIKHKFGTLKDGCTLCMYEGQIMFILDWACDIVVTDGDPEMVESNLGTNSNYFRAVKKGTASVDLLLNPDEPDEKISFKLKVYDESIFEEFKENFTFTSGKLKLKYKDDILTGKLSFVLSNKSKKKAYIKILNMCAKDDDTKFIKIGAGKQKTIKVNYKYISENECFEDYYKLSEKENTKLAKGKTVVPEKFGFEGVIKYKNVYFY